MHESLDDGDHGIDRLSERHRLALAGRLGTAVHAVSRIVAGDIELVRGVGEVADIARGLFAERRQVRLPVFRSIRLEVALHRLHDLVQGAERQTFAPERPEDVSQVAVGTRQEQLLAGLVESPMGPVVAKVLDTIGEQGQRLRVPVVVHDRTARPQVPAFAEGKVVEVRTKVRAHGAVEQNEQLVCALSRLRPAQAVQMRRAEVVVGRAAVFMVSQDNDVDRHEIISKTLHPADWTVELESPLQFLLGEAALSGGAGKHAGVHHGWGG